MRFSELKQHFDKVKSLLGTQIGLDAKPLEIRAAVLDAIEARVEPLGRGRRAFPYDRIVVRVLIRAGADKAPLDLAFADLDARVRERLREIACEPARGIEYKISLLKRAPSDWAEGQVFALDCQRRDGEDLDPGASSLPPVRVNMLKGVSTKKVYTFKELTIFIGRTSEVKEATGGLRRNHIAFEDADATVSRAHARMKYDADKRAYRLLDDGSARGTLVIRGGRTIQVPFRDPRGVLVQSGDELQFGDASIRVTIGA